MLLKHSTKMTLFFLLILSLFFLMSKMAILWTQKTSIDINMSVLTMAVGYTILIITLYYMTIDKKAKEGFWDVTPAAKCKGGPYMWQGDSETAKMCRAMAETEQGRCEQSAYECGVGYIGTPRRPFYYSPLSDDNFHNERCDGTPYCGCAEENIRR
jgi:hypothetical protein